MRSERARLAQLAFASTALVIPGCGGDEVKTSPPAPEHPTVATAAAVTNAPPEIVSAGVDDRVLTIRFSEPIVLPAVIDPSKFRLTYGFSGKDDGKKAGYGYYAYAAMAADRTWYSDVGRFAKQTTKLRQIAPDVVQIPLPSDFEAAWVCEDVRRITARGDGEAGLYLHYAAEGGPGVADATGKALASVAPYWVTAKSSVVEGDFVGEPIPVKLRCP
jgi:hypothetical protein